MGFLNTDGVLYVVTRAKEESVAQLREYYVDLVDVARTIVDLSSGKVAQTIVVQLHEHRQQLRAFVVLAEGSSIATPRYLQTLLRNLPLPAYLRPTRAVVLNAMPMTQAGKTDRRALRAMNIPRAQIIEVIQPISSHKGPSASARGSTLGAIEARILSIWEMHLPLIANSTAITSTSDFFTLGGDTSLLSQVLHAMRRDFRGSLMFTYLANNSTLRGITAVTVNRYNIFGLAGTSLDWVAETALPTINREGVGFKEVNVSQSLIILLTGATGFLGRSILANLIKVDLVHCVAIRSLSKVPSHPKVIKHGGDLTKQYFGMSPSDWQQLGGSVDAIIHAAALVDHIRPYASLRTANVLPREETCSTSCTGSYTYPLYFYGWCWSYIGSSILSGNGCCGPAPTR